MKMFISPLLFGLALTLTPCVTVAQSAATVATQNLQTAGLIEERAHREAFGLYMARQDTAYRDSMNPRRVRRAEAAARLVNEGDCAAARALAARDNDVRLLARLADVCGRGGVGTSLN